MSHDVEIDVFEVQRKLVSGEIVLIDCREESEWHTANISGAKLLPMSRWGEVIHELSDYAEQHIVVHCHHGGRSLRVTQWLRENGFPNTRNMTGGIHAWSEHIDPSVPQY
jgi:rhodanese-related sulfurtransferase